MPADEMVEHVEVLTDEGVMDLSGALDFDVESLSGHEAAHKEVVAEKEISADDMLDMSEFELPAETEPVAAEALDVMNFDMPEVAHHEAAVEADELVKVEDVAVPEAVDHDDNMLNFDFNLDEHHEVVAEAAPVAATEDIALDFSGISLDFDEPAAAAPLASPAATVAAETTKIDTVNNAAEASPEVHELTESEQEVKTKLDLAQVYLEMGDNENAREILHEVMQEGNAQQQEQAHAFLQQAG
jgi:pilus assembly protein FimV